MLSYFRMVVCTLLLGWVGMILSATASAGVIRDKDHVFIVDRTGERWDVTQAVSLGFDPYGFQFGIGRNAIRPLDASNLDQNPQKIAPGERIIGVENGPDAQAYVVRKLTRHEIANTELGETPIAAAY